MRELFAAAEVEGFLHAREIDGEREVCHGADDPVVLASVFKIPIVLEYARQAAAGLISRTERLPVTMEHRDGGIGTSGCADEIELSLRDLALFMMSMSDNAATDVLLEKVGVERVNATLAELGLKATRLVGDCRVLLGSVLAELGAGSLEEAAAAPPEVLRTLSVLDPARTSSSTPRETTTLLAQIWRDEAGPPQACSEVRQIMGRQVWPHRLSSGFGDDVRISAKTGTIFGVRNEAGVVEYPDGRRYAVAVYLRPRSLGYRLPKADAVIGAVAREAVDELRG
ncbi:serine hydrolase [Nonomuraea sp. NPDC003804]|uniref:serine hydrolase n=1 Tax=Nonomuraea sp. NPDC003804 TaxID=3154547 RepID=UPI0033A6A735